MKKIAVGIVGLNFGEHVIQCLLNTSGEKWFSVCGVCDLDADLQQKISARYGLSCYSGIKEMLMDPAVEVVGLFTGPFGRAALMRQIILAGKHIITTKPFEIDSTAAAEVVEMANKAGVKIFLNSPGPRLCPDMFQVKLWEEEFNLGRPIAARADVWCNYREKYQGSWYDDPLKCPAAPLLRLGIYLINDLIPFFEAPRKVTLLESRLFTGRPTTDNAQLGVLFENGGLVNVFASFCINDGDRYRNSMVLNFENGTVYRNVGSANPTAPSEIQLVQVHNGRRACVAAKQFDARPEDYDWFFIQQSLRDGGGHEAEYMRRIINGVRVLELMAKEARLQMD